MSAVSKFEYHINPAQTLRKSFFTFGSCIFSPSGNRNINLCYFVKCIYLQNSAFTINTSSNKRPLKNRKIWYKLWGLYSGHYRMKFARLSDPWELHKKLKISLPKYVITSAKWICKKRQGLCEKCLNTEFLLVRISLHSDWIRRFSP